MSLFKRAMICMKRNFIQSIILFFLVFLLGLLSAAAISIGRTIERTEDNVWRQLPAIAMIEEDWVATELYWQKKGIWPAPPVTLEMVEQVASLSYVRTVELSLESTIYSRALSRYFDFNLVMSDSNSLVFWGVDHIESFLARGVSEPSFLELNNSMLEINNGSTFTEEQIEQGIPVVIISHELADKNNLTIGSTVMLESIVTSGIHDFTESWFDDENIFDSLEIDFEVIGIYEVTAPTSNDFNDEYERLVMLNSLFVPYTILAEMRAFTFEVHGFGASQINEVMGVSNYLLLYDARDLPRLREAASELLPEFIVVTDVSDSFSDVITSMENVRGLSIVVLLLAISGSVVVLSLVIILLLRDRRHEIGIYLSLGEKKRNVLIQFLTEIILISLTSTSLALFVGAFLSSELSQNMLLQELSNVRDENVGNENQTIIGNNIFTENREIFRFAPAPLLPEELIELFDTSMDGIEVLMFYGVAMVTVLASTILPTVYVMRLEPREILL